MIDVRVGDTVECVIDLGDWRSVVTGKVTALDGPLVMLAGRGWWDMGETGEGVSWRVVELPEPEWQSGDVARMEYGRLVTYAPWDRNDSEPWLVPSGGSFRWSERDSLGELTPVILGGKVVGE